MIVRSLLQWQKAARPNQLPPPGNKWAGLLILAGRGFGKSRAIGEEIARRLLLNPGHRVAIVARTFTDGVRTVVEKRPGGLLWILERAGYLEDKGYRWNRSTGELTLVNGSAAFIYSSEKPDALRGPEHHVALVDELAAWKYMQETWDMLNFGLRLGDRPQILAATTPRPVPLIQKLVNDPKWVKVRGSTFDNQANLPPSWLEDLRSKYDGTRIGRQELYGEVLEDTPGALWSMRLLEATRIGFAERPLNMDRVVVAIDPAVTAGESSDETGIVAAGRQDWPTAAGRKESRAFVLADESGRYSPQEWAMKAIALYHELKADRIVAEANQGGDMVRLTLQTIDPRVPVTLVRATRGKAVRAEPVAALYEQKRVHHVGYYAELEAQLTTFVPGAKQVGSPDRMDALVWALTALMLDEQRAEPGVRFL